MIVRYIFGVKNRIYRERSHAVYSAEYGCDTSDSASVIQNALDCFGQSRACGNRTIEDQYIFALDHWLKIITEDNLSGIAGFRSNHVDRLMSIQEKMPALVSSSERYAPITSSPSIQIMVSTGVDTS